SRLAPDSWRCETTNCAGGPRSRASHRPGGTGSTTLAADHQRRAGLRSAASDTPTTRARSGRRTHERFPRPSAARRQPLPPVAEVVSRPSRSCRGTLETLSHVNEQLTTNNEQLDSVTLIHLSSSHEAVRCPKLLVVSCSLLVQTAQAAATGSTPLP